MFFPPESEASVFLGLEYQLNLIILEADIKYYEKTLRTTCTIHPPFSRMPEKKGTDPAGPGHSGHDRWQMGRYEVHTERGNDHPGFHELFIQVLQQQNG